MFALCLLLTALGAGPAPPSDTLAIRHVTVIDASGAAPRADMTVLVASGRILRLGPSSSVRVEPRWQVIEGAGRYLIPGLWDMHVHLVDAWPAAALGAGFLDHGVVGVRDMGTPMARILALRAAFTSPASPGPRIVAAGPFLNGSRAVPGLVIHVETDADGRRAADSVRALGADFVKVLSEIPPDAFRGAAREARRIGLPIVGHLPAGVTPGEASDEGLRSLEHQFGLALSCAYESAARCAAAGERVARLDTTAMFARLRQNGTWLTPTFVSFVRVLQTADSARRHVPELGALPEEVRAQWLADRTAVPSGLAPALARERAMIPALRRAGVAFLAGTDFGDPFLYPGASLHDELAELVAAGLTPMEALQTATRNAAAFFGTLDSAGTIGAGKLADLVLLDADPLADIRNTRRVAAVIVAGVLHAAAPGKRAPTPAALDSLLERFVGRWTMAGTVRGQPATYALEARRTLQGRYVELHMIDRHSPPGYEARVIIGVDSAGPRYIAHWLDNFGAAYSIPPATGTARGDTLELDFPYPSGAFRDTFVYDRAAVRWDMLLERADGHGGWTMFARYAARRLP